MLACDNETVQALLQFGSQPLFRKLLRRSLPQPTLRATLHRLIQKGSDYPADLQLLDRLSDAALTEEVGPPPDGIKTWVPLYYTYYVTKKFWQGRPPTTMELALAVIDPATFVLPELKAGPVVAEGASKVFTTSLKEGGLALARDEVSSQVAKQLAEKGLEKEVVKYGITGLLTRIQAPIRTAVARQTTFEITQPLRFMFSYSGVGRESLKRLTGLEAKLFMRSDAGVYSLGKHGRGRAGQPLCQPADRVSGPWPGRSE